MANREAQREAPPEDILAKFREAKIARVTPAETGSEDVRRAAMSQLFGGFFSACQDAARNQGTARVFKGSEMERYFG